MPEKNHGAQSLSSFFPRFAQTTLRYTRDLESSVRQFLRPDLAHRGFSIDIKAKPVPLASMTEWLPRSAREEHTDINLSQSIGLIRYGSVACALPD